MRIPRKTSTLSSTPPSLLARKNTIEMAAVTAPPIFASSPIMALVPSPAPAILPMLNTMPPMATRTASTQPKPGITRLPSSWARIPDPPITRHTFNCTAMSRRIETTIANAKAAPSLPVNTAVCVRNPGPMALVAMRKMAPRRAVRVDALAAACPSVGPCCDVCSGKAHAPIL